jgi:hypothetical protein
MLLAERLFSRRIISYKFHSWLYRANLVMASFPTRKPPGFKEFAKNRKRLTGLVIISTGF